MSRISKFSQLCISCELLRPANSIVEEAGANYSNDEGEDRKQAAQVASASGPGCSDPPSTTGRCRAARSNWTFHVG